MSCEPQLSPISITTPTTTNRSHHPGRRRFLNSGLTIGAGAAFAAVSPALPAAAFPKRAKRVADLTRRLVKTFPSIFGLPVVFDQVLTNCDPDGFVSKEWTLVEACRYPHRFPGSIRRGKHTCRRHQPRGPHRPIVVVAITEKAMENANATVEVEDLIAFEGHGGIPTRALVCMNSGWADKVDDSDAFRGGAGFPALNFPGFSLDATDCLVSKRNPVGIGLDTMSLDPGDSGTFDFRHLVGTVNCR